MTGIRRVTPGQAITSDIVTAPAWNMMADAAEAHAASTNGVQVGGPSSIFVEVRNKNPETTMKRFATVALGDPIFIDDGTGSPRADSFDVDFPEDPESAAQLAIVQEPISPGRMGRALIFGVSPVGDVEVVDESHTRGRVGADGKLTTAEDGAAVLLWVQPDEGQDIRTGIVAITQQLQAPKIYASIEGSEEIGSNRWRYDFEMVRPLSDGTWEQRQDDQGQAITGMAYNTLEAGNSGSGLQGNGVHISNLEETGFAIVPIGRGAVVELRSVTALDPENPGSFETVWVFTAANLVDGACG